MRDTFFMRCKIGHGGFSSERRFEIELPGGENLVGTAYVEYLVDSDKKPLPEDEPAYGKEIDGFVKCRKIRVDGDRILVEVPSADILRVTENELEPMC